MSLFLNTIKTKENQVILLIKWNNVTLEKKIVCLEIKRIRIKNGNLLIKWLWRYIVKEETL